MSNKGKITVISGSKEKIRQENFKEMVDFMVEIKDICDTFICVGYNKESGEIFFKSSTTDAILNLGLLETSKAMASSFLEDTDEDEV